MTLRPQVRALMLKYGTISAVIVLLYIALSVRNCEGCAGCDPKPVPLRPIDASVQIAVIDRQVDAAVQHAQAQLAAIDARHDAAIAQFTAQERADYVAVRAQGPQAVERWMNDWYARERAEGGSP